MKVRLTVTVEVDPAEWADAYGVELDEVRADVRNYFTNQVLASAATDAVDFTVRVS